MEKEKDLFNIVLNDGSEKTMEIVSIYKMDGSDYNYIIYCELDKSHHYIAKYMGDDIVNLSTDFNEQERSAAVAVMRGVVE